MRLPWHKQRQNVGSEKAQPHGSRQMRLAIAAAVVAMVAVLVVPTLAWLSHQRSLQTVTRVSSPNAMIGAGDVRPIMELDLSDIDVSDPKGYKDVVFCVYCASRVSYKLQLAHTTNIGFTYSIYSAEKDGTGPNTVNYLGNSYSFNAGDPVKGNYLNLSEETDLATEDLHLTTYNDYSYVQKNAEPLYWQAPGKLPDTKGDKGYYVNYYVLRISWDNTAQNNKETDLVYLMAESETTEG